MPKRPLVSSLALVILSLTAACEIRPRPRNEATNNGTTAAAPQAPAPPPPPVQTAPPPPPVQAAAPAPVKTVFVQTPSPVKTVVVASTPDKVTQCRNAFVRSCTLGCTRRLSPQTSSSRRTVENQCFAECTRAASKQC